MVFENSEAFYRRIKRLPNDLPFDFPCVFKFDWGGGGDTVYPVHTESRLMTLLNSAETFERSGQKGFLLQEMIPTGARSLRVAVIGQQYLSYWRVQPDNNEFWTGVAQGAHIEFAADPDLQKRAVRAVRDFCQLTDINLAGFDLLFTNTPETTEMYFLEINYFFGRKGLGGSEGFYRILMEEIERWLEKNGLIATASRSR
jgi:ribosomal protein S6--L-glutamate ligase